MTHPAQRPEDHPLPHVEMVRRSMTPAIDDEHLDAILLGRTRFDVQLTTTIVKALMRTPDGQAIILNALDLDEIRQIAHDTAEKAAAHAIMTQPVPPHEHQAQDVVLTSRIPGFSRLGAIIGAAIGGLLAWLLVMSYSVTTIAVSQPNAAYNTSLVWVKTAIVIVVVLFFAMIGGLVGPKRKMTEQLTNVNIRLKRTHMHQGRVPSYDDIAATASRASRGDNQ